MKPNVANAIHASAVGIDGTSRGLRELKEHTDQDYLGSLRGMEAYVAALKALLKSREQKQLGFEALTDYHNKAVSEREQLTSNPYASTLTGSGASAFLQRKLEDVRGVGYFEQGKRKKTRTAAED